MNGILKNVIKIEKNYMDFEISIKFEIQKVILLYYLLALIFLMNFPKTFRHNYYAKFIFLAFLI